MKFEYGYLMRTIDISKLALFEKEFKKLVKFKLSKAIKELAIEYLDSYTFFGYEEIKTRKTPIELAYREINILEKRKLKEYGCGEFSVSIILSQSQNINFCIIRCIDEDYKLLFENIMNIKEKSINTLESDMLESSLNISFEMPDMDELEISLINNISIIDRAKDILFSALSIVYTNKGLKNISFRQWVKENPDIKNKIHSDILRKLNPNANLGIWK